MLAGCFSLLTEKQKDIEDKGINSLLLISADHGAAANVLMLIAIAIGKYLMNGYLVFKEQSQLSAKRIWAERYKSSPPISSLVEKIVTYCKRIFLIFSIAA